MAGPAVGADNRPGAQGAAQFSAPEFKGAGRDKLEIVEVCVDAKYPHRGLGGPKLFPAMT